MNLEAQVIKRTLISKKSILLMTLAGTIADSKTVMYALHTEYFKYFHHANGKMKRYSSLHAYIQDIINTDVKMAAVKSNVCPHICYFIA